MIIGITGHARHGKDSTADIICKHFGYEKYSLADVMKDACRIIFGWDDSYLYGDKKDVIDDKFGISPRHALQTLGTEWGQLKLSEYDNFAEVTGRRLWVNALLNRASGNIVIPDVRFTHEVDAIRERGGFIIKVSRDYLVDNSHISESSIDEIIPDFTIKNYGSLIDLEWLVCDMLNKVIYDNKDPAS
jgi:hypothetical protein